MRFHSLRWVVLCLSWLAGSLVIAERSYAPPTIAGDYDDDGDVDSFDYLAWRTDFGQNSRLNADGNGNEVVDTADYVVWRNNNGFTPSVGSLTPEPSTLLMMALAAGTIMAARRRRLP